MAGGVVIVLGLGKGRPLPQTARHIGTGMHGGVIYIRGKVDEHSLGEGVATQETDKADRELLDHYVAEFTGYFGGEPADIMQHGFVKLVAKSHRPYGDLYAY